MAESDCGGPPWRILLFLTRLCPCNSSSCQCGDSARWRGHPQWGGVFCIAFISWGVSGGYEETGFRMVVAAPALIGNDVEFIPLPESCLIQGQRFGLHGLDVQFVAAGHNAFVHLLAETLQVATANVGNNAVGQSLVGAHANQRLAAEC